MQCVRNAVQILALTTSCTNKTSSRSPLAHFTFITVQSFLWLFCQRATMLLRPAPRPKLQGNNAQTKFYCLRRGTSKREKSRNKSNFGVIGVPLAWATD